MSALHPPAATQTREAHRGILGDVVCLARRRTIWVYRETSLEKAAALPQKTILAGGSIRGGTSILGFALNAFGLVHGSQVHDLTHEDLEFERARTPEQLGALMRQRDADHDCWALKLPNILKQMPFYQDAARNPIFVVIFRNPLDLAFSIMNRDGRFARDSAGIRDAFACGADYYSHFFNFLPRLRAPAILIPMEAAQAQPQWFVEDLCRCLRIDPPLHSRRIVASEIARPGYKSLPGETRN